MSSEPIVDAHHHIWCLDAAPWLAAPPQPRIFGEYAALRRDYRRNRPAHLSSQMRDTRIAQTLKDARLMLDQAARAGQHLPLTVVNAALLQAAVDLHGPDVNPAAVIAAIGAQVEA